MKKLFWLLPVLALFAVPAARAQTPSIIYCVQLTQTPCASLSDTNPYSGTEGDHAWQFSTKINDNFLFLGPIFGLPNNTLVGNSSGSANGLNYITLGTNLSLSGNVLNATGGGGGGGVTSVGLSAPAFFTVSGSPITNSGTLTLSYSGSALPVANGGTGALTLTGPIKGNGTGAFTPAIAADVYGLWSGTCSAGTFLRGDGACQATNPGTVTSVSVATANGLSGSVATATSTPAITLSPTFTGITYSNGSGFAAAIASNFPILNQNTTGNAATATGLAATPSQCTGSQFAVGITVLGSANCATPAGGGNMSNSGSPAQYQTSVFVNATAITGVGPGTSGQAFVSNGASANPSFSSTLSDVTSVNGTSIPSSATLVVNGGALGTPSSGNGSNLTSIPTTALTGALQAAQEPAHTGDATNTAGSLAMTVKGINGTSMAGLSTGVLKNTTGTGVPSIAAAVDIYALWSGSCNSSTYLNGAGACSTPAGSGTVTNTGGALTANDVVLGAGGSDTKVAAGIVTDGTSKITLGVAGTSVGALALNNATSGTVTLQPVTGALGTVTASLPANTGTVAETNLAETFSALQTFGTNISIGGVTAAGATGTSNVAFSNSPTFVTPTLGAATAASINGDSFTAGTWTLNGAAGKTLLFNNSLTLAGTDSTTMTFPGTSQTIAGLSTAQTWAALQKITNADLGLLGTSTGYTLLESGLTSTSNNTLTLPTTTTDTLAALGTAETWTAAQTFTNADLLLKGSTSGSMTLEAPAIAASDIQTFPATSGTVADIGFAQTWAAVQTFGTNISIGGVTATGATGTGNVAFSASPTFTGSPVLATPTATTLNGDTFTTGTYTLTGSAGKTFDFTNTLTLSGTDSTTMTFPATSQTIAGLGTAETWTAAQIFTNSDLKLLGSSTGVNIFTAANSSATNYTTTVPANTGTLAEINLAETWSALQTFTNSDIALLGSSTGFTTFTSGNASATAYTVTVPAGTGNMLVDGVNGCAIAGSTTGQVCTSNGASSAPTFQSGTTYPGLPTDPSAIAATDLVAIYSQANSELATVTPIQLLAKHLNPLGTITATSLTPDCSWPDEVNTAKVTTATGTFTINNPTVGTPTDVYSCRIVILFSNSQTAAFGTAYYGGTVALPTTFAANQQKYLFLYSSTAVATTAGWDFSADALGYTH